MKPSRFLAITACCAALGLVACEEGAFDNQGYTKVSRVTTWSYSCGGKVKMNWEFKEGDKGRYVFNSGTILVPASEDQVDRRFKRQDGVVFMVTGYAERWLVRNEQSGTLLKCDRSTDRYYMPDSQPAPQADAAALNALD